MSIAALFGIRMSKQETIMDILNEKEEQQ